MTTVAPSELLVRLFRNLQSQADDDLGQVLLRLIDQGGDHGMGVLCGLHAALDDDESIRLLSLLLLHLNVSTGVLPDGIDVTPTASNDTRDGRRWDGDSLLLPGHLFPLQILCRCTCRPSTLSAPSH